MDINITLLMLTEMIQKNFQDQTMKQYKFNILK